MSGVPLLYFLLLLVAWGPLQASSDGHESTGTPLSNDKINRHTAGACTLFSTAVSYNSTIIPCQFSLFSPSSFEVDGLVKVKINLVLGENTSSAGYNTSSATNISVENTKSIVYIDSSISKPSDFCSIDDVESQLLPSTSRIETHCYGTKGEDTERNSLRSYLSKILHIFSFFGVNDVGGTCSVRDKRPVDDDLLAERYSRKHAVAYSVRGNCSFDVKAKVAASLGFAALLIETTDDAIFPPGSQDQDFKVEIPVLMIPARRIALFSNDLVSNLSKTSFDAVSLPVLPQCKESEPTCGISTVNANSTSRYLFISTKLFKAPTKSSTTPAPISWSARMLTWPFNTCESSNCVILMLKLVFISIVAVLIISCSWIDSPSKSKPTSNFYTHFKYFIIFTVVIFIFLFIRMATLRIFSIDSNSGEIILDHNETDEKIFEKLLDNVRQLGWTGYRLDSSTIQQFNLSPDNYSPNIFIHPPIFTYSSLLISRIHSIYQLISLPTANVEFPLPIISLVYHIGTLASLPVIIRYSIVDDDRFDLLEGSKLSFSYSMALLAGIICIFCPIMAFCSSKYWIDNCLLFTCTTSAAVLLALINGHSSNQNKQVDVNSSHRDEYNLKGHALSGLYFGILALNTKITALAMLLPFSLWITHSRTALYYPIGNHTLSSSDNTRKYRKAYLTDVALHLGTFLITSLICMLPWTLLHYNATGRIFPNSWPSATMIKNSPFLQQAINRPWFFYLEKLLFLSPVVFIGLCVAFNAFTKYFLINFPRVVYRYAKFTESTTESNLLDNCLILMVSNRLRFHSLVLGAWAAAFLAPFTLLGSLGAGFQTRFILPAIPPLSILACYFVLNPYFGNLIRFRSGLVNSTRSNPTQYSNLSNLILRFAFLAILLGYSAMHTLYYSVLYPTFFADLDYSLIDIIVTIIDNIFEAPPDQKSFERTLSMMKHYGLKK